MSQPRSARAWSPPCSRNFQGKKEIADEVLMAAFQVDAMMMMTSPVIAIVAAG
jgi:hypothetical protein